MAALYVSRSTADRPERRCRGCNAALALAHVQSPGVAGQCPCDRSGGCRSAGGGRAARRDRTPGMAGRSDPRSRVRGGGGRFACVGGRGSPAVATGGDTCRPCADVRADAFGHPAELGNSAGVSVGVLLLFYGLGAFAPERRSLWTLAAAVVI